MKTKSVTTTILIGIILVSCSPINTPVAVDTRQQVTSTLTHNEAVSAFGSNPNSPTPPGQQVTSTLTNYEALQQGFANQSTPSNPFLEGLIPNNGAITATLAISEINPTLLAKSVEFNDVIEYSQELPYKIYWLDNCNGSNEIEQTFTNTFTHEIIDQTKDKFGIEIPIAVWLNIVADIEYHYGITDIKQETVTTKLKALAGEYIEYKLSHKQIWESGTIITQIDGTETVASYTILKGESLGIASSEKKTCP